MDRVELLSHVATVSFDILRHEDTLLSLRISDPRNIDRIRSLKGLIHELKIYVRAVKYLNFPSVGFKVKLLDKLLFWKDRIVISYRTSGLKSFSFFCFLASLVLAYLILKKFVYST
jgi:hypothetical protein